MSAHQQELFGDSALSAKLPPIDRQSGLAHLKEFAPYAGKAYAASRNFDKGQSRHVAVSRLSAHLRRRSVTEEEVLYEILGHHHAADGEKFILELYWRAYFKGWLANRPQIWTEFLSYQMADTDHPAYQQAIHGNTGIECFDSWVDELKNTNYLHNHARIWFASIWIFTLGLDWQAGAAFFATYLRDFCPASNTLGWRWVAGLHTHGKHYLATADNIAKFTENRFSPTGQLNEQADAMSGAAHPPAQFELFEAHIDSAPYILLATAEDCHLESLALPHMPAAIISLPEKMGDRGWQENNQPMRSDRMLLLDKLAIADSAERASRYFNCPHHDLTDYADGAVLADKLEAVANSYQAKQIIAGYQGVGFWQTHLDRLSQMMPTCKIGYVMRDYDQATIKVATKGFFAFKAHIPDWLGALISKKIASHQADYS